MRTRFEPLCFWYEPPIGAGSVCRVGYGPARGTDASSATPPASRHWAGTVGRLLRSGLAVLLVCAVLAPTARAFEVCPNAYGPDAYCPDGWACCLYPYGPGYWC
jgi:hypothetical protein